MKKQKQILLNNKNKSSTNYQYKKVKVKKGLAELGLFAEENIKKGDLIIQYIGEVLTNEEADKLVNNRYLFYIEKDYNLNGATTKNIARYANHSCNPNAESEIKNKKVFLRAIKDIEKGEEITFDYGEEYFKEYLLGKCNCGAKEHLYSEE